MNYLSCSWCIMMVFSFLALQDVVFGARAEDHGIDFGRSVLISKAPSCRNLDHVELQVY